ncbi:hypothetical protein AURDEDRAFT_163479 [Auricularia subglabra TFB-10046 SS5]|nr:hypothetical protein AURDEDRAFT_163479 [Auricularia subglabra TFB-10046 SS5]
MRQEGARIVHGAEACVGAEVQAVFALRLNYFASAAPRDTARPFLHARSRTGPGLRLRTESALRAGASTTPPRALT